MCNINYKFFTNKKDGRPIHGLPSFCISIILLCLSSLLLGHEFRTESLKSTVFRDVEGSTRLRCKIDKLSRIYIEKRALFKHCCNPFGLGKFIHGILSLLIDRGLKALFKFCKFLLEALLGLLKP